MGNKKLHEQMKAILNGLTDEQKEKVKACKDVNKLVAKLGEMGAALPDELLDAVAGGMSEVEYLDFYSTILMPMIDKFNIGHGDWQKQDKLERMLLNQYSPDKRLSDYSVDEALL